MKLKRRHQLILGCLITASLLGGSALTVHADAVATIDTTQYYTQATKIKVVNGNYLYRSTDFTPDQQGAYIAPGTILNVQQIVPVSGTRGVFKVNYNGTQYYFSAYKYYSVVTAGAANPTPPRPATTSAINANLYYTQATQIKVTNGNYVYRSTDFTPAQQGGYIAPGTVLNVARIVPAGGDRAVFEVWYNGAKYYFSAYKYYSVVTAGAANPTPSKPATTSAQVLTAWKNINYNGAAKVSIALYNNRTNETVVYTPRGLPTGFYNASIVKVSILGQFLRNNTFTNNPTAAYMARLMITQSDNNAANYLYHAGGWSNGLQSFYNWMGMTNSTANRQNYWGLNTTSATDQLKLLNAIYYQKTMLSPSKLSVITGLMSQVSSAQLWGVGNVSGANVQVKNGWLPLGGGSSNAVINSLGHIQNGKVDYTLAILTNGNTTQGSGIALANKIGWTTFNTLNR